MNEENRLTFLDLFSGIGGFRRGMELAGHKCLGFCEYDRFARASYISMHCITEEQRTYLATLDFKKRQKEILKEEYLNNEWYSEDIRKVTGENVPKVDMWTAGFPCLVAGTLITTSEGVKPIEDIQVGEMVLTHKNRFQRVLKTMVSVKRGIYTLKVQGSPVTEVTGNHRFYVRYRNRVLDSKTKAWKIEWSDPEWKAIKEFTGKEYVLFPCNNEAENPLQLSEMECWLVGRYIADGHLEIYRKKPGAYNRVSFCIGNKKRDEFERMTSNIKMYTHEKIGCASYVTRDKRIFSLCEFCGRRAFDKKIPGFIMNLPQKLLETFLDGYMAGDGCFTNGWYQATTISKVLAYQLGQCIQKVYKNPYINVVMNRKEKVAYFRNKRYKIKPFYHIRFHKEYRRLARGYYHEDNLWMPVRKLSLNAERIETVYNMEVENDNSYTANNMGLHNCQDISIAGNQLGFDGDRSSLFFEIIRILQEQKEEDRPEWIILENVKNILSIKGGWVFARILLALDECGYNCEWQVFNTKNFGIPQNRDREDSVEIEQMGQRDRDNRKNLNQYRVYDPKGLAPCLNKMDGGAENR